MRPYNAVAVTVGPGLSMCLRVGVVAAQRLSHNHSLPIIPVHHMASRRCRLTVFVYGVPVVPVRVAVLRRRRCRLNTSG